MPYCFPRLTARSYTQRMCSSSSASNSSAPLSCCHCMRCTYSMQCAGDLHDTGSDISCPGVSHRQQTTECDAFPRHRLCSQVTFLKSALLLFALAEGLAQNGHLTAKQVARELAKPSNNRQHAGATLLT